MKKIFAVIAILFCINISYASFPITEKAPAVETKADREKMLMESFVKMSVKDYEVSTGKKLNFAERLAFKVTKKRFEKKLAMAEATTSGFNLGGFALGFLLGLIGVLIAYLVTKDSNLRKWSWIGLGTVVVLSIIIALL